MKRMLSLLLVCLLLTGCSARNTTGAASPESVPATAVTEPAAVKEEGKTSYQSRFDFITEILLSDDGIRVNGDGETAAVFTTNDIIYYEDRETYASGNPYGEGTSEERHTAEEAAAHTVVNITKPGAYRVSGKLSAGQLRIDLGEDTHNNPNAVVELILSDADITCTVAPAILFRNVYECDEDASEETASADVNTSAAGANLILEGSNLVSGSHVAKIFKDKDGEKKLWKQDGAIYSYQSMNIFGPGSLELTADNEGLGTELHLTINGGNIHIYSDNDGINTNADGVSVTTINGGNVTIFAGLGAEGDGIDSNGYLVINGGSVVSCANPKSDAGLDSDLGSFINGGTVIAMGSTMDWAESNSDQVTMNLQFAQQQKAGAKIVITREDGTQIFSFESDSPYARPFSGLILSHAFFTQGEIYHIYVDGVQMAYTGTDVGRFGPGGMPMDFPEGERPPVPEDMEPPEGFEKGPRPEKPDGEAPPMPEGDFPHRDGMEMIPGVPRTDFYMQDKVNAFSGVTAA